MKKMREMREMKNPDVNFRRTRFVLELSQKRGRVLYYLQGTGVVACIAGGSNCQTLVVAVER